MLNLGTSENTLCFELIEERVSAAAAAAAAAAATAATAAGSSPPCPGDWELLAGQGARVTPDVLIPVYQLESKMFWLTC